MSDESKKIQIQLLLKLNRILKGVFSSEQNSNTTLVKVKC